MRYKQIAEHVGLSESRVSVIVKESKLVRDKSTFNSNFCVTIIE
jgi:DNA-directed RNA polymerase specialized sigma subunit